MKTALKDRRPHRGMAWLTFFQVSPGILFALPIYLIVAFMFFQKLHIPKRISLNFLLGFCIILAVVLAQSILRNENATIVAMVSDLAFREVMTKGIYSMENGINWLSFFRMFVIITVTLMLTVVVNRTAQPEKYITYLVYYALASFLFVFILANSVGADQFKAIIAPLTSLDTSNYLVSDEFGYRISGFFHEPSHASIFFGAVFAAYFVLRQDVLSRISILVILFVFFTMSRSLSILAVFVVTLYFLYAPKWASLGALIALTMLQVILRVVAEYYAEFGLFRSVYERAFESEMYNATTLDQMLGFDFGQVYSFEPIVGLTLQIGSIGLVGLYFILQRDIRTFGFLVFTFTLVPQLWYYPAWGAVGVFMIALHAKEMSAAGTNGRKLQNMIRAESNSLRSVSAN